MIQLSERVEALKLRTIRDDERSGDWQAEGFVSTASALRKKCRMRHGTAQGSVRLARKLEVFPEIANAFEAGEISREHVEAIARAHTPERAAMLEDLDLEFANIARLTASSCARSTPRCTPSSSKATPAPRPKRRAEALEAICRRTLAHHDDGTTRRRGHPHMIIVQDVNQHEGQHPDLVATVRGEATMFGKLSATTLERLCCDAKICRVLTDGPSQILDVGRTTRNVPTAIWNALVVRDRHCTAPGCDRSPEYCQAHHIWFWEYGGRTNLESLRLLCFYHHKELHIKEAKTRTRGG